MGTTNSIIRCDDFRWLEEFKAQHPRYTVILGLINDKTFEGKSHVRNGVHVRKTIPPIYI